MKIGILGGTFNPIHFGHLRAAEEVRERLNLERVMFIPCGIPPHRPMDELVPFIHRYQMVKLAIADNPFFYVSKMEGNRDGKSYTVDTLKLLLQKETDAEFYFILGLDAFLGIDTWKSPQTLFELAHFVVLPRKTLSKEQIMPILDNFFSDVKTEEDSFFLPSGKIIYYCPITLLNISASQIRRLVRENKSIRYLVPEVVAEYIQRFGFYRGGNEKKD